MGGVLLVVAARHSSPRDHEPHTASCIPVAWPLRGSSRCRHVGRADLDTFGFERDLTGWSPKHSPRFRAVAYAAAAGIPEDEQARADIRERCRSMTVKELRTELGKRGLPWADALEKSELVDRLTEVLLKEGQFSRSGRFSPGSVSKLTGPELDEELKDTSSPLLLDVYATWCGPCQMMAPFLEAAAKELGGRVRVAKLDSDAESIMATRLQVGGLPTIILFDRQGKEVARQEGALMTQQLVSMVEDAKL